jgi:hypothetical protein
VRLRAIAAGAGGRFAFGGAVTAGAALVLLLQLGARNGQEADGGEHERKEARHMDWLEPECLTCPNGSRRQGLEAAAAVAWKRRKPVRRQ